MAALDATLVGTCPAITVDTFELSYPTDVSRAYLDDCQVKEPTQHIPVYADAEKVWTLSEKLVGESFHF